MNAIKTILPLNHGPKGQNSLITFVKIHGFLQTLYTLFKLIIIKGKDFRFSNYRF